MIGVLVLLGGLTIAGTVIGNSMLQKKANTLLGLKLDNKTLEDQQSSLIQAKKDIDKYSDLEKIAKTVVPQEKDQARTVREIINIGNAAGVPISSISFPTSNLGQAQPQSTAPAGETPTAKVATPPITQVKPVDNIKGLYQLEVTVQSDANTPVSYAKFLSFLTRLEQNRRTAQVSSITVLPSAKNRDLVTFSLVVNVYIKP